MDNKDYQDCCYFDGTCSKDRNGNYKLIEAKELKVDIRDYLKGLKISIENIPLKYLTEKSLIENRTGKGLGDCDKICPRHRQNHGIGWRQSKKCQHPQHLGKATSVRTLTFEQLKQCKHLGFELPIGSAFCTGHRLGN